MSVQRRNTLFVALDGAAVGLMAAAASFASVFVIRLGASPLWVSLLSSIPSTIRLVMTIPWSQFAERQTRPQRVFAWARVAVHVVYPLIAIVPFFLRDEWAAKVIIIIWSLSAFPGSLSNMMFTLVMGHAVPRERRAFLMSRRWMVLGVAKLIALSLESQLIGRMRFPYGYQIVYGLNALIAIGAFYCATQIWVREREIVRRPKGQPLLKQIREGIGELARAKPFLIFVSGRSMLNLGLALVTAIIPIYWINHLNVTDAQVGYFNAALSGAALISYLFWVRVKRRFGTQWTLIPSVLGTALYPALLALARVPLAAGFAIVFNGLVGSGLNLAFFDALFDVCPRDKEARFVAINMTAVSLMGVIAPPIGAALLQIMGIRWLLVVGTLVSMSGGAIFIVTSLRKKGR
jgi:Na+/melibiose symporter-like transporter